MDESELRRKALESMLKKKEGAKGEDEAAEDGEVVLLPEKPGIEGSAPAAPSSSAPSTRKSKWADDDEEEEAGGGGIPAPKAPEGVCFWLPAR
jgi:hypothetical protein